jgi:L-arabinose transport system substrate-binding protein
MNRRFFLRQTLVALPATLTLFAFGCNTPASQTDTTTASSPGASASPASASSGEKVKIGFVVKSATEEWFQTEWKFAQQAADKNGFELVKLEASDAEKTLSALDNLAAQGAKGVIICAPDVKLGSSIVSKCKEANMKLMSVDDRLVGADGKPLADVPHLGISAYNIGKKVGQALSDEIKARKWNPAEVGALELTIDELETARDRIRGAEEVLLANGFPKDHIYKAAWKKHDIPGAQDVATVALTQHPEVKKWVFFTSNDDGVLGAVRATEDRGIKAEDVIGVGINGTSGVNDFKKAQPTGFFASVLLSPKQHGYNTAETMYHWVKDGKEPPKETYTEGTLITRKDYEAKMKAEGLL